jgi:CubicO group peptidase (beta-lactamase class C family)
MNSLARSIYLLATLLAAWSQAAVAQAASDLETGVDQVVEAEMQRQKIPGVAVGVFQHGEPLIMKGYGYANVEHEVPITPATLFQSASIGKQFTAVATMLQVEDGKVSLDESIRTYFPDAPASWQPVTVRQLLNHTSGIADYFEAMGTNGTEPFDVRRDYPPDELRKLFYQLPMDFPAGSDWHYSNTGYALLGFLIRRVSGRFYGDELEARVFTPLGMDTAQVINEASIIPNRAAGYQLENGEIRNQEWYAPLVNTTADGALYLSLLDYLAWERGLRRRAILTSAGWNEIYTPATLAGNGEYGYGLGWRIGQSKGGAWYHHSGSSQGFNLYFSRYIADDLAIVVLTNLYEGEPEYIVDGIAEIIDPAISKLVPAGTDGK